ncbi:MULTISPECIES: DUF4190 domain-containing protein [Micromonospora]|uniref:DUF4190 domain-containing protein n=1 Tax=Micromonospora yangpuensis TaxID=683228 RepID=A0A1C6U4Q7_9ACTN|nr:DUF4190 domain-containing protein [Micromonospora yangpuensis]GGL92311.1 hypothetical protein GCM10012279_07470 [Micromonospora yangpuensis]SCL49055.1 protein of unknown function [Micromonospora yangpuensis]
MTNPPPPGNWPDPTGSPPEPAPQSTPPVDPTLPASGQPFIDQSVNADPYAPNQAIGKDPYAPMPYGGPQPYPTPYPAGPGYGYPPAPRTNGMALAAMILSLVGVMTCITAPVGAILGHVSLSQIRQTGEGGESMAKAAIIVGWILTGLVILGVIAYIAIIAFAVISTTSTAP